MYQTKKPIHKKVTYALKGFVFWPAAIIAGLAIAAALWAAEE